MASMPIKIFLDRFPSATPVDDVLIVDRLLELTDSIIDFCGKRKIFILLKNLDLQGFALYPVKKDVGGNAKKISKAAKTHNAKTLAELLDSEKKLGSVNRSSSGSTALLWLFRTMELIFTFLTGIVDNPEADVHQLGRDAYSKTLMRYHHIAVQKVFYLGLGLFPHRTEFLRRLALNQPGLNDYVMKRLELFVKDYRRKLIPIRNILVEYGLENSCTSDHSEEMVTRDEEETVAVR
uniref:Glycolipid transfer protein n=1 Tax=Schistocephalus solidus TaxID=70667 RepID=A0A0X3Q5H6_SCHSO